MKVRCSLMLNVVGKVPTMSKDMTKMFYKLSFLSDEGAGNLGCTEEVYNAIPCPGYYNLYGLYDDVYKTLKIVGVNFESICACKDDMSSATVSVPDNFGWGSQGATATAPGNFGWGNQGPTATASGNFGWGNQGPTATAPGNFGWGNQGSTAPVPAPAPANFEQIEEETAETTTVSSDVNHQNGATLPSEETPDPVITGTSSKMSGSKKEK